LTPDTVTAPAAAAAGWRELDAPRLRAGNGLRKYRDVFSEVLGAAAEFAPEPAWAPSGESLLAAAWRARSARTLGDGDVATVLPVYTRLSDAEEAERAGCDRGTPAPSSGVAGPRSTGEAAT
jgi:N6-L-threonylcarbamoyladenine synthase